MNERQLHVLLADDDIDDCLLFKEALNELPIPTNLATLDNGEKLMRALKEEIKTLPDVLFLDLNMPLKNGFECLEEIKLNDKLKNLPVIIFSTSYHHDMVSQLYKKGATHFIQKPNEFARLKKVIHTALSHVAQPGPSKNRVENFVLEA